MMPNVEKILNGDEFFGYTIDTLKEGIEQIGKENVQQAQKSNAKGFYKTVRNNGHRKGTIKLARTSVNGVYAAYKHHELNGKS